MSQDLVNELEWLANAVFTGQLRLPYDEQSYLREEDLYDFARANGLDTARMHYMIEQELLVAHRNGARGRAFNACSVSDTMEFVDRMKSAGYTLEMQQAIVQELTKFEEGLWKSTVAQLRKSYPGFQAGSLADARLRVAASVSVINAMHKERQWVLTGTASDPAREKQLKRYIALTATRRRKRLERIEYLSRTYGHL